MDKQQLCQAAREKEKLGKKPANKVYDSKTLNKIVSDFKRSFAQVVVKEGGYISDNEDATPNNA